MQRGVVPGLLMVVFYVASAESQTGPVGGPVTGSQAEMATAEPQLPITPPYQTPVYAKPADDSVAFGSLIEASGWGAPSNSDWIDVAIGNFCGGSEPELALVKNAASQFSILRGPTPFPVGTGDPSPTPGNKWWTITGFNYDGGVFDEIVAVHTTSNSLRLSVIGADSTSCDVTRVIASTQLNISNAAWTDSAVGRFDETGKSVVLIGGTNVSLMKLAPGAAPTIQTYTLGGSSTRPWKAVAAGDLDQDGTDELVLARDANDGQSATIYVYKLNSDGFYQVATSGFGNTGNSDWAGATVGDFNGDARGAIVLTKNKHSNFVVLDWPNGASELRIITTADLDSVTGQNWRGVAAADWISGSDQGASELIAVRAATGKYRADVFVYGDAFHRVPRDTALERTKAVWAWFLMDAVDVLKWAQQTNTDTINWTLAGPGDYRKLVTFLKASQKFAVNGKQIRVWATLYPPPREEDPTDAAGGSCSIPEDIEETTWNDLEPFKSAQRIFKPCILRTEGQPDLICFDCNDFLGWASLLGRLAQENPHFVAYSIDDYGHFFDMFPDEYVAELQSRLRSQAGWISFVPTVYYGDLRHGSTVLQPDIARTFDTMLFYFRNERGGEGPCSSCSDHTSRSSCLDGICAEETIDDAPAEIDIVSSFLPAGRKLQLGAYFVRHGTLGWPSIRYDYDLVHLGLSHPSIGGVTAYADANPDAITRPCGANFLDDRICALRRAFGE